MTLKLRHILHTPFYFSCIFCLKASDKMYRYHISLFLFFTALAVVIETRPPLIAYTGQPLQLSAKGLRSAEAGKAAKYAAQQILDEHLRNFQLKPCVAVIPEILYGTSKVVAGTEYKLLLRLRYKQIPSQDPDCRVAFNHFQDEECRVVVVYQPYKPTASATFALLTKQCEKIAPFFPKIRVV